MHRSSFFPSGSIYDLAANTSVELTIPPFAPGVSVSAGLLLFCCLANPLRY